MKTHKGFTLIEMLVVIGIIVILMGASIAGYSKMTKSAERTKAQELVSNAATALTVYFQQEGAWPKRILTEGKSDGRLDDKVALILAKKGLMSISSSGSKLTGLDQFGIVSPWATAAIKRAGNGASLSTKIPGTQSTVQDHILHFAVDLDGDGIVKGANVGGSTINVRATAIVWCGGKDGVVDPYPSAGGSSSGKKGSNAGSSSGRLDDIYSWTRGQTQGAD